MCVPLGFNICSFLKYEPIHPLDAVEHFINKIILNTSSTSKVGENESLKYLPSYMTQDRPTKKIPI